MERVSFGKHRFTYHGRAAELLYDILVEPVQKEGAVFCENYGARIELKPEEGAPEVAELRGVTPFRPVIERFLALLCRNGVTPATAGDVLEDYLAEL